MKKTFLIIVVSILTALISPTSSAHDYVFLPYEYELNQGDQLELHLFVTDGFNIALERPVQSANTLKYELISENGRTNLLGTAADGTLPILLRPVDFKGQGLVHMTRGYSYIGLDNKTFKNYLKGENIENIEIDESKPEQKERYTRYIKTLVQSDDIKSEAKESETKESEAKESETKESETKESEAKESETLYKKNLGHNLEILLNQDPYQLEVGDSIQGQLLFKGAPLSNKLVTARNRLNNLAATSQLSRTDKKGQFKFKLDRAGDWFFHTTHMIASPIPAKADWESFWTSYSFGVSEED